jgi:hypothetical protein
MFFAIVLGDTNDLGLLCGHDLETQLISAAAALGFTLFSVLPLLDFFEIPVS